jgi:hypothetical protein
MHREKVRALARAIATPAVAVAIVVGAGTTPAAALPVTVAARPLASDRLDGVGLAAVQANGIAYVGGTFTHVLDQAGRTIAYRTNLAAFDMATGHVISSFRADVDGPVRALASDGRHLFVGGSFSNVRGVARLDVASVDLTTGAVDAAFRADSNSNVYSLAVYRDRLVVGGSFSTLRGLARQRLGVVATSTGAVQAVAPRFDGTITAVGATSDGRRLIVGGAFTTVNGVARKWAAVVDGTTGALAPAQLSPVEGPLSSVVLPAGDVYVTTSMTGAGNSGNRYRLADGHRMWRQVCDGDGQAIDEYAGTVYTGFHDGCAHDATVRLVANDAATGTRDGTYRPSFDRYWGVWGLDATAAGLLVAGDFTRVAGVASQGFAIFPKR